MKIKKKATNPAENSFIEATEAYIKALKESGDDMRSDALQGFIDGWSNKPCRFSYEDNEFYNIGYGSGENHLIP